MEVRGAYYHSIKRATFSVLDFYNFHRFFLITKGVYQKDVRDHLGVREKGMNALLSLHAFFCCKLEIPN